MASALMHMAVAKKVTIPDSEFKELLYNDYTNLNKLLMNYYNLDLLLFYEEFPFPDSKITEYQQIN